MRIDENTNTLIYFLYEAGGCDFKTICERLELSLSYDRQRARELIRNFISIFSVTEAKQHPILALHPQLTRQLVELLQQDSKGGKVNLYAEAPSVF